MEGKSLRARAKEHGVSHSYLSQVINGKRPASEKVLTTLLTSGLLESDFLPYNEATSQRSSGVEQRFRKPPVDSSNLSAGCICFGAYCNNVQPNSFLTYSLKR